MESMLITGSASSFHLFSPAIRRPACTTRSLVISRRSLALVCSAQFSAQPRPRWPVRIFDSTLYSLKAGGSPMIDAWKLEHARKLARLGVDVIEAGNPAESKNEFESVKRIAEEVGNRLNITDDKGGNLPVICARAGFSKEHIKTAWQAVGLAKQPRLNLFFPTGSLLNNKSLEQRYSCIDEAFNLVHYAINTLTCPDVQLSIEYHDWNSHRSIIYKMAKEAIRAGATTVSIHTAPDLGRHFLTLLGEIKRLIPEDKDVIVSCRCYEDSHGSGAELLAEAVKLGAKQVETTLDGVGGVVPLKEFEEAIRKRRHDGDLQGCSLYACLGDPTGAIYPRDAEDSLFVSRGSAPDILC